MTAIEHLEHSRCSLNSGGRFVLSSFRYLSLPFPSFSNTCLTVPSSLVLENIDALGKSGEDYIVEFQIQLFFFSSC